MIRFFTEHPETVGETYFEHLQMAFGFGATMILGGLCCLVHGLLPAFCTKTGSRTVARLHQRMVAGRAVTPSARANALDFVI
jgi:hypothetical protein